MNWILPSIVCLALFAEVDAQNANGTLSDEFRKEFGAVEKALNGVKTRLDSSSESLGRIKERTARLEDDRAKIEKIDALDAEARKAKLEALSLTAEVGLLKKAAADGSASPEELKKQVGKLQEQSQSLNNLNATAQRLSKEVEEFKAFTSMQGRRLRADVIVGLEARRDGKRIPLSGKSVQVSLQDKDGPLTKLETVVSDPDGIVRVTRPDVKDKPAPMFLAFGFPGDEENRPCDYRIQVR